MADILIKDTLRASVEAASAGKQTILYSSSGEPSYFNIFPAVNIEDIDPVLSKASGITGVHPAFKVGDKKLSQLFISTYQLSQAKNGEMVSRPGVGPRVTRDAAWSHMYTLTQGLRGNNYHVINSIEHMLLEALVAKSGRMPFGNLYLDPDWTMLGWDPRDKTLKGTRVDGVPAGEVNGAALVGSSDTNFNYNRYNTQNILGSGPLEFNMGHDYNGLVDLVGNGYQNRYGVRLVGDVTDGYELQVLSTGNTVNTVDRMTFDLGTDTRWMAIDATTGAFVKPTGTGTLALAAATSTYKPTTPNSVRFKTTLTGSEPSNVVQLPTGNLSAGWSPSAIKLPAKVLAILQVYGFIPDPNKLTLSTSAAITFSYAGGIMYPYKAAYDFFDLRYVGVSGVTDLPRVWRMGAYMKSDLS